MRVGDTFGHGQRLRGQRRGLRFPVVAGLGGPLREQSCPQRTVSGGQAGQGLVAQLPAGGKPGRVGETFHGQGNLADQHRVAGRTRGVGCLPQRAGGGGQVEAAQLRHAQSAQQAAPVRRALDCRGAQCAIVKPGRVLPGKVGHGVGRGPLSPPHRQSGVPGGQGLQQVMRDHRRDGIRAAPQIAGHPGVSGEPVSRRKFQQRGLADEVMAELPPAAGSDQPTGGSLVKTGQHGTHITLGNHGDS